MYSIKYVHFELLNTNRYWLFFDDEECHEAYQCQLYNSNIIKNILFLKGIVLEDRIVKEIDEETYNLLFEYSFKYEFDV
jgi:hypothetical protein